MNRHMTREMQLMEQLGVQPRGGQEMRKISDFPNWDDAPYLLEDFYTYVQGFGTIVSGATSATLAITIQQDSKFEWMKASVQGNLVGESTPFQTTDVLDLTVQIQDSGTGRLLMNNPVPVNMIAGNGQLPFILPTSRIFQPNSTISITMANYGATDIANVYFAFIGRKIFKGGEGA